MFRIVIYICELGIGGGILVDIQELWRTVEDHILCPNVENYIIQYGLYPTLQIHILEKLR